MPRIEFDMKLEFKDVLFRPKRSTLKSRSEVLLTRQFSFKYSKVSFEGVPIIASNVDTVGTFEMAKVFANHNMLTCIHKFYNIDDWRKELTSTDDDVLPPLNASRCAVSSGCSDKEYANLKQITGEFPELQYLCLDVANGYSENFVQFIRKVREECPRHTIIAGNVVTGEMVEEIILSGADIVKVGIGPSSICTTRRKTGVGYPQLSAILECADAAHGLNGRIIADGGCYWPGDVAKAFGAGADFVMLGRMLTGHDQCGGKLIEIGGAKFKLFNSFSLGSAMERYKEDCDSCNIEPLKETSVEIPYRGDVEETIKDVLGGLRSACTYVGALKLKELSKRTSFIRVSQQANEVFAPFEIRK